MATVQDVQLDQLDVRLIDLLDAEPRIGVLECSRRLQVARGTVQARLDKLLARGVIAGLGPQLDPAAIGFAVTSFVTLEIHQRPGHDPVTAHLHGIPEVLEAHTITGSGDVLCRIVARSNADLQRVLDQIVSHEQIARASSIIALAEKIPYRVLPLLRSAVQAAPEGGSSAASASPSAVRS
ncbi:Lrp/AsnC family transcriptional regulator [Plantactinospora sp. KLBMP9567]|uniref:Lrp/AsnC family transcriptional regulator n=1 Tax=Plantactinospora sp. KLBMP9567 TaxID=3085900 RepID=UPI0029816C98|nr:Lrp/AsnC family transcriptional regulator [Plantactinospora sp. KLBMP9567]MDW5325478.1 Lrp/AsnC family transcriptional regulator [Plantactinospora sp. KLBMP9567]